MHAKRLRKVSQDGEKFAKTVVLFGVSNFGIKPIEHLMKGFGSGPEKGRHDSHAADKKEMT